MLNELKDSVYKANLDLVKNDLVISTFGNVSGFDHESNLIVIKPSGVPADKLEVENMVIVDMDGKGVEGKLKPSSDTPTHLILYKNFPSIRGIVHTHSEWATCWAQAGKSIPPLGTTHADHFYGEIPCTRKMTKEEIENKYEEKTGDLIVETFKNINPDEMPAVLVNSHGPFIWAKSPGEAVQIAVILEEVAKIALYTSLLGDIKEINKDLLKKHFFRKHGSDAYYGQDT